MGYEASVIDVPINMDYRDAAVMISNFLRNAGPGVFIWGGEPTVELPENPGLGGRNQALGLLLSTYIDKQENISILVAGTDGTDGPTDAAGVVVDGDTVSKLLERNADPKEILAKANAYPHLKSVDGLFSPGPTGTNVMDLVIAIVK